MERWSAVYDSQGMPMKYKIKDILHLEVIPSLGSTGPAAAAVCAAAAVMLLPAICARSKHNHRCRHAAPQRHAAPAGLRFQL